MGRDHVGVLLLLMLITAGLASAKHHHKPPKAPKPPKDHHHKSPPPLPPSPPPPHPHPSGSPPPHPSKPPSPSPPPRSPPPPPPPPPRQSPAPIPPPPAPRQSPAPRSPSPPPPSSSPPAKHAQIFNIMDYRARGDGIADDTKALLSAWAAACQVPNSVIYLPAPKTFLISQITVQGPCHPNMILQIDGTVVAPADPKSFQTFDTWLLLESLGSFTLRGSGTIDGRGAAWWKSSCKKDSSADCRHRAPTAVKFFKCQNLIVQDIKIQNSQQMHLAFLGSQNVLVSKVHIQSPGDSPNTDGIHVQECQNVTIDQSSIGAGDDCVSIGPGSSEVYVKHSTCGPGHGISIGSLGKDGALDYVKDIYVQDVTLTGTTNGLRIKSWQGGRGSASSIRFEDVKMDSVSNPIIIDQFYCDSSKNCPPKHDAVQVFDVTYSNVMGTSASKVATSFKCSDSYPCRNITMDRVQLMQAHGDKAPVASCLNAYGTTRSYVIPQSCLGHQH